MQRLRFFSESQTERTILLFQLYATLEMRGCLRLRGSLAFGAAVRLGLLLHTASRRQAWRLTTAVTACSCLRLAVATNSPRKGLSPPIQCPCQAHPPRHA